MRIIVGLNLELHRLKRDGISYDRALLLGRT
jgi:hypothetical protein